MNVKIENKSELGRELMFEIEKKVVEEEKTRIVKNLQKNADVEGFRKGNVPENIIEMKYESLIKEEMLKSLIPQSYFQSIKENNLNPVSEPEVGDVKFEDGKILFKVYIEVKPDVKLKKYEGLSMKRIQPDAVTEEKVEEVLKAWERKPEFAASVIDPVKRKAWRKKIREQLEYMSKSEAAMKEENQLWENLLAQVDFPVPERLVLDRARRYTEEQLKQVDLKNKNDKNEINKIAKEIFEKLKPAAEKDVRKYFILDKVAEEKKLIPDEKEIEERIIHMSKVTGDSTENVRKKIEEAGKMDDLKEEIKIDKAFQFIKKNAQVIERIVLPGEEAGKIKKL